MKAKDVVISALDNNKAFHVVAKRFDAIIPAQKMYDFRENGIAFVDVNSGLEVDITFDSAVVKDNTISYKNLWRMTIVKQQPLKINVWDKTITCYGTMLVGM